MSEQNTETASQRKKRAQKRGQTHRAARGSSTSSTATTKSAAKKSPHRSSGTRRSTAGTTQSTSASKKPTRSNTSHSNSKRTNSVQKNGGKKRGGGRKGNRRGGRRDNLQTNAERILTATHRSDNDINKKIPALKKETLRIIPIGGNEEVGRNMNVFEYEDDIVIIDMGMQFPEEDMHGIDYIVPNASYLRGKEKKIRAVFFTHGHLDHIGAAPILLKQLNYPPIVARDLTLALIKKKLEDIDPGSAQKVKAISIKDLDVKMRFGAFNASFFDVEHSIMDSMGVALETPVGTPVHLGDWMINHDPLDGGAKTSYAKLAETKQPSILMLESLCTVNTGPPKSEKDVQENLQKLISDAPGRVIVGTFASQVKRVADLLSYIEDQGKKVALDGYSMRTNMEIAQNLGYLKVKKDTFIPIGDISKYPDNKVVVICTGAQGEHNAVLNRIVTGNHRFITLQKSDTILFSSSVIPGNERSVQRLKDNLYRKCDNVIHSEIMNIHIGGHSTLEDLQTVVKDVAPKYFLPVYANHYMLKEAVKAAVRVDFPKENSFVLENGGIIEFRKDEKPVVLKERADSSYVFVDGLGIGDIGHIVLRDRQMLSEDGMYMMTILVNSKSKAVVGNIQVTSRGFIVVKDNFDLVNETKKKVQQIITASTSTDTQMDWRHVEKNISDQIGQYLFQKTARRPMILPIVMEV